MGRLGKVLSALMLTLLPTGMLATGGCVRRVMHVQTDPPGAIVTMNDQEVGRTPFTTDFTWYGKYDVQVRKEGYQTLTTRPMLVAPWWQWPPFDLVAELMPWHPTDERSLNFTLEPQRPEPTDPGELLSRAVETQGQLESSQYTHKPTTAPTTRKSTTKTTKPSP